MYLVIVESPSKAKTINKYLGKDYKVIASYGHIRQLVQKSGSVDPEHNFKMLWQETEQGKKHLKEIKSSVAIADEIILATDPDREGEAISWHIVAYLKEKKLLKSKVPIKRVVFNSITKESILDAFKNPRNIDDSLVSAYLTRIALDYLVGFNISPILWRKLPGSRSAGRVQSVALKLIAERELEIDAFKTQEYWSIAGLMQNALDANFNAKLVQFNNKKLDKLDIKNATEATEIEKILMKEHYILAKVETKKINKNPYAPFTTSSLQQEAFHKLGFAAKKTMSVAQKLYEGINLGSETVGLITYMRTDATQISPEAITNIRNFIEIEYSNKYLAKQIRIYKTKAKNAQEAHEAIRPTSISLIPAKIQNFLTTDEYKLYDLIWKRSVASQMASALYNNKVFEVHSRNKKHILRASGSTLEFDGFYKLYKTSTDKEEEITLLPNCTEGENLNCIKTISKQHFTEPPPRYTEASLVKNLEELSIGRPSTYANIISVLQIRKYTRIENKKFYPENRGRVLSQFLISFFSKYVEYSFTAEMERMLDEISSGKADWHKVLSDFWDDFHKNVEEVSKLSPLNVIETLNNTIGKHFIGENTLCPKCLKGQLSIKNSKFGVFIGCSLYPECTYIKNLEESTDSKDSDTNDTIQPTNLLLGQLPSNSLDIYLKKGPYGFYVELQDKKPKRTAIPKNIDIKSIDLEKAIFLISLPKEISKGIFLGIGRFGPYLKHNNTFYSVKENFFNLDENKAKDIIETTIAKKSGINLGIFPNTDNPILLKFGKFGSFIQYNDKNYKMPKELKNTDISLEQAISIIKELNKES